MSSEEKHIEVDFFHEMKYGESVCGDDIKIARIEKEKRIIMVLSDGLGSGIKASLLSQMTSTMALRFVSENMEILNFANVIMDTLPVCDIRKISYATFTIVDTNAAGFTRIIEMDNPEYIHLRAGKDIFHKKKILVSEKWPKRKLLISEFNILPDDRIIIFSDGVTQAGLGERKYKFGWKREGCFEFIKYIISENPVLSARDLSRWIVKESKSKHNTCRCGDDTSCGMYYVCFFISELQEKCAC